MQHVMDRVYTAENLARYGAILDGFQFGSSAHFPGAVEPPRDPNAALTAEGLPRSAKVYDTLLRYQSLVPKDNAAFREFALRWWEKQPSSGGYWTEREHAQQWESFTEETSATIRQAVQGILDRYFADGRPEKRGL